MTHEEMIDEYQCSGCMHGPDTSTCPKFKKNFEGCTNQAPGTIMFGAGKIFLGMPKGFNRLGPGTHERVDIYEKVEDLPANLTTIFSLPVWKHLDKHGNTCMRWFSPRVNQGWVNVIKGDVLDKFPNTLEITQEHMDNMD